MTINLFGIKIYIKKENLVIIAVFLIIILGYVGYRLMRNNTGVIIETGENTKMEIKNNENYSTEGNEDYGQNNTEKSQKDEIQVYVTGCVNNPGVITLDRGDIIDNAIKKAGGVTKEADISNINLVYKLNCNVMLKIRSKEEIKELSAVSEAGTGIEMVMGDGGVIVDSSSGGGKVNINTAGVEQLKTLPGIGDVTANDIIVYRDKNGAFKKIEDIMKVAGIKEGRFEPIKELITVD
jgi:competence protein ComEA